MVSLIQDISFENGFKVHGPRHEDGFIANYYPIQNNSCSPVWSIGQWGVYKNPLTEETKRTELPLAGYLYENKTLSFSFNPSEKGNTLKMECRATGEFAGKVRKEGESWPHLLIGQDLTSGKDLTIDRFEKLVFRAKYRLIYAKNLMDKKDFDPKVHGAQVHQFITFQDMVSDDFIWFGIPFFDIRQPGLFSGYVGIDGGKDDASGKLIYICPQDEFTTIEASSGEWIEYDIDLLPLVQKAFYKARSMGIFSNAKIQNIRATSTNVGWEMFGECNGAFEIKDLSLNGIKK